MNPLTKLPADSSHDDLALVSLLMSEDQGHLFENWDPSGTHDEEKNEFLKELKAFDHTYPGGISAYIQRARKLLVDAQQERNPFDGYSLAPPSKVDLTSFSDNYFRYEKIGFSQLESLGIVLVAGGLGERLGYDGIKLDIPVELVSEKTYLGHICDFIRSVESRSASRKIIPLVIMTSDQTHDLIVARLKEENYFDLKPEQVTLLKQTLVPSLSDVEGHLALKEKYKLLLKPNGHGAVHQVLFSSGTIEKLQKKGVRYLAFVQDTNAQIYNALPAALGAAVENGFDYTSTAVQRVPKEACGALVHLQGDGRTLTTNIEYNQLDGLLRSSGHSEGDVAESDGYSPYAGNVNGLVVRLASYFTVLKKTQGMVPEFANPKFVNIDRLKFKEPARLETMMQDLPQLFAEGEKVGVVLFHRKWCFSPLKNRLQDARTRHQKGLPPECAATAESDFYLTGRMKCRFAGMNVEESSEEIVSGVPFQKGAKVILRPSFSLTVDEIRSKISGGSIGKDATLVVDGVNVHLKNVTITDGASLEIYAVNDAEVTIDGLEVTNEGSRLVTLSEKELQDPSTPQHLQIRGYRIEPGKGLVLRFEKAGCYCVGPDGKIQSI